MMPDVLGFKGGTTDQQALFLCMQGKKKKYNVKYIMLQLSIPLWGYVIWPLIEMQ